MKKPQFYSRLSMFVISAVAAAVLAGCGGGSDATAPAAGTNQLYSQTNLKNNTIVRMARSASDGSLTVTDSTFTDGTGTDGFNVDRNPVAANSLSSQYAVTTSSDGKTLFAVNAGDNTISTFSIDSTGKLTLLKNNRTTGLFPNSLAYSKGYLYAAFLGSSQVIAYKVGSDGSLTAVDTDTLPKGFAADDSEVTFVPTQVKASPDGAFLLVGSKSHAIISYPVNADGSLGLAVRNKTTIAVPFDGVFVGNRIYIATDVTTASLSSYTLTAAGTLEAITPPIVATGQGASCWLSITPNGSWAYVGNGSGSISSYAIAFDGSLTLKDPIAAPADTAVGVAGDSWISGDGKFLYSTYLRDGSIVAYKIDNTDGALTKVGAKVQVTPANGGVSSPMQGVVGL